MLADFMGMFWLVSGLISLRWGVSGQRSTGSWLVAGIIGVIAGLGMLGRGAATTSVREDVFISVLGLVIMLTGALNMFGGFRKGPDRSRQRSWSAFLLGIFEVILGIMLVIAPLERGTVVYLAASVWALVGGFILIGEAVAARRLRNQA